MKSQENIEKNIFRKGYYLVIIEDALLKMCQQFDGPTSN